MQTAQTQMNVRIESSQKRRGDSVLADFGRSPSSAVRSLWAYLAEHKRLPEFMLDEGANAHDGSAEASKTLQLAEEGAGMAVRLAEKSGIHCASLKAMSYGELREAAFDESLEELGAHA